MSGMNILCTSCKSDVSGGGQKSLLLQLAHLDRVRYTPFLLCPGDGELAQRAARCGVSVHTHSIPPVAGMSIPTIVWLAALLRHERIHVVHTDSPRETLYAGLACKLRRVPLIWHARVSAPEPYPLERLLYALSDAIIAVSAAVAQRFADFPRATRRVHVIHNAVDLAKCHSFLSARQGWARSLRNRPARVGILGAIAPLKGHDDFLAAAKIALTKLPGTRFFIVGGGGPAYLSSLRQLAADLGIAGSVEFLGYQNDPWEVLSELDILVNASKVVGREGGEGLSRAIIEAMAMEVAIVATNVGGNPEAVEDGVSGLLVPPGNPARLADAILRLCTDRPERERMGILGRRRVEDHFNVRTQMAKLDQLYQLVLAQRRPGGKAGRPLPTRETQ